jgi:two-component system CheB/CheR fusion protein
MDSGKIDNIFDPFVTTKHDGLGMGLSISRTIIEAHSGWIRASQNPEGGAIFTFSLPVYKE